ncbi:MAG: hypothetical protein WCF65_05155 [Parachlamydiaceae bacterium]
MIDDQFRIYTEQLREGHVEQIDETLSPKFLDINERDLSFNAPVKINGQAYLADDTLVLHLDMTTAATLPCAVCNDPVTVELAVKGFYHAVPLQDVKNGIYDFREILRETILLETPLLAECLNGKCPRRQEIKKFFKKENPSGSKTGDEEGYRPFADLDFDSQDKN